MLFIYKALNPDGNKARLMLKPTHSLDIIVHVKNAVMFIRLKYE